MSMFGKGSASKWATIGATLSDVGESLGGGQGSALQQLARRRQEEEAKRQREAYMAQFGELLGGQSIGEAPMTPGIDAGIEGMAAQAAPTAPKPPSQADVLRRLLQAPEGVDTRALMGLYEATLPPEPKKPLIVGGSVLDPVTFKPLYEQPDKPERLPMGFYRTEDGRIDIDPGYLSGRQRLAGATRAPPRARATGGGSAAPSAGPARLTSKAQFDALPKGATFIAPDGTTRRKP